ncbi:MAG: hypothetical protein ACUZ8I_14990 [Candidatus Scalindua sp.]
MDNIYGVLMNDIWALFLTGFWTTFSWTGLGWVVGVAVFVLVWLVVFIIFEKLAGR